MQLWMDKTDVLVFSDVDMECAPALIIIASNACNYVIFTHIHIIIAALDLFHAHGRVLDHQMWIPIDLRAPAWKGDPLRDSHHFHTRKIANCACW